MRRRGACGGPSRCCRKGGLRATALPRGPHAGASNAGGNWNAHRHPGRRWGALAGRGWQVAHPQQLDATAVAWPHSLRRPHGAAHLVAVEGVDDEGQQLVDLSLKRVLLALCSHDCFWIAGVWLVCARVFVRCVWQALCSLRAGGPELKRAAAQHRDKRRRPPGGSESSLRAGEDSRSSCQVGGCCVLPVTLPTAPLNTCISAAVACAGTGRRGTSRRHAPAGHAFALQRGCSSPPWPARESQLTWVTQHTAKTKRRRRWYKRGGAMRTPYYWTGVVFADRHTRHNGVHPFPGRACAHIKQTRPAWLLCKCTKGRMDLCACLTAATRNVRRDFTRDILLVYINHCCCLPSPRLPLLLLGLPDSVPCVLPGPHTRAAERGAPPAAPCGWPAAP